MHRYFGKTDVMTVPTPALAAGSSICTSIWLERDRVHWFGPLALLSVLDSVPDLDVAFPEPADRDAAHTFMDLAERGEEAEPL